jgi:hypothetical protein
MKRRDLITVAVGVASGMFSGITRAAIPCPPPQVDVEGGQSATTTCAKATYSTTFPVNEMPLSEGGRWRHLSSSSSVVRVDTLSGVQVAHSSQNGHVAPPYDDSQAYMEGFGDNYEVEATVWKAASQTSGSGIYKEVEILLRWTEDGPLRHTQYGDTTSNGYEIQIAYDGSYANLGRALSENLQGSAGGPGGGLLSSPNPSTGGKFKARVEGQRIRAWWNDVLFIDYTDNDASLKITKGNPGIGFWANGVANNQIGFSAVTITAL